MNMDDLSVDQMRRITLAQCAMLSAYAEIQGMIAENQLRADTGSAPAYGEKQFDEAMTRNGAHWNQIVGLVNGV